MHNGVGVGDVHDESCPRPLTKVKARPFVTTIGLVKESYGLAHPQTRHLPHQGRAGNSLKGICSRASDILQGLEPPCRKVSDLAHRYGDKVAVCTAATCRFLLEAPPLNRVDRGSGKHMKSHKAFYMPNFRKARSHRSLLCSDSRQSRLGTACTVLDMKPPSDHPAARRHQ